MVEKNQALIKCGQCDVIIGKDEKNRPTIATFCPSDENGNAKLSEEVKALRASFQSEEIVLKPAKIK